MFKTLRIIKMVALYFILSGFAAASFNEKMADVLNNLNAESSRLVTEYTLQNSSLASEANSLTKVIGAYKASINGVRTGLSQPEIFRLWLHFGDLYRKASLQQGFATSKGKRILINIKGHMNVLLEINGKSL